MQPHMVQILSQTTSHWRMVQMLSRSDWSHLLLLDLRLHYTPAHPLSREGLPDPAFDSPGHDPVQRHQPVAVEAADGHAPFSDLTEVNGEDLMRVLVRRWANACDTHPFPATIDQLTT